MKQYLKKRYLENSLLLLLIIFGGACKVVAAYFIGDGFNELIKSNTDGFFYNIAYAGIVFLLFLVSIYIKIPYENYVVQKMITDIRCDVVDAISKNNYANFNKKNSGDYISWLSNDLMIVEEKGFGNFYQSITAIIETLLAIVGLFAFHWSIIVFSIVMSVLTLVLPALVQKSIQNKAQRYSGSLEKLISKNTNYLQGFDSLLSFNKLGILKKIVATSSNEVLKESVSLRKSVGLAGVLGGLGNLVGQVGVVLLTGILALKNIVGFGSILTVESLTSTIFNSVGNIMNITVELNIVVPIFEKFEKFKEEAKAINDKDTGKKLLNEEIETIVLEDVSYKYEEKSVLKNISYVFNKYGKYAIVGESGSGKSTLLKLLTGRIENYEGAIKFNGEELEGINKHSLYDKMLYIPQEPYIFTESLRFNITLGDDYADDKVKDVLESVGLGEFLVSLEDGLDTELVEGGKNLSGGQKQRIALARGIIREKKVVLLDEITSNLDKDNAEKIEELLLTNPELTVILITHRLDSNSEQRFTDILKL